MSVGRPIPLIDARAKVTGQARYTDDHSYPNMLKVAFLRSPLPHAKIKSIDITQAAALPGVVKVAIGSDIPIKFGILPISRDEPAIAIEKVRYIGEIVAAVAAENLSIAKEAVLLIKVEYEPLEAMIDMRKSLEPCAPENRIHSHGRGDTNIHKTAEHSFHDPKKAIDESPNVARGEFKFAAVSHGFTEPHATLAIWNPDETLKVISATQVPHYLHRTLSEVLELPMHKIQVVKPALGGGFGGKGDPFPHEIISAYLARHTGRAISCRLSREEVFLTNHGRHPTELAMSIGCDANGKLTGLDADILIDGGAYASFGVVTAYYNGVLLQGPYKIDRYGFRTRRVYTNKPQSGAMRGHGAVNPRYAVEVLLDTLAHQTETDPCDLRLNNFLSENTLTVGQLRITSNGVRDCLEAVRTKSKWNERYGKLPFGRGIGVACGSYISGSALPIHWNRYPQTVVHVKLDMDGRIVVFSGASDIGQGSDTMLAQVAAEVLGLPMDFIQVVTADTSITPVDLGSYSSRVTFMVGNAAKSGTENLRNEIAKAIAKELGAKVEELHFADGKVTSNDGKVDLDWLEAVEIALAGRGAIVETGSYQSPKMGGDFKGAGAGLSPSYSFGAFITEVEVNPRTGRLKVVKVWAAHDCGKAINPMAVEGQIEGSIHMGLGQALSEELRYHDDGHMFNSNFLDYRIPTALDTPEMDITIIESNDPEGPFGAKEAGEGPIHPVLPSIGNAIFDAVGVRIYELPITPERMIAALAGKGDIK